MLAWRIIPFNVFTISISRMTNKIDEMPSLLRENQCTKTTGGIAPHQYRGIHWLRKGLTKSRWHIFKMCDNKLESIISIRIIEVKLPFSARHHQSAHLWHDYEISGPSNLSSARWCLNEKWNVSKQKYVKIWLWLWLLHLHNRYQSQDSKCAMVCMHFVPA